MGRRAHKPDPFHRRQVEAMAAYGVPETGIARVVGIDAKTLRKHYREELDTGQIKATAKVAESLFRKATTDGSQSVTAAIFWLKTRGGWREAPQAHEVQLLDLTGIPEDELVRMLDILRSVTRGPETIEGDHSRLPSPGQISVQAVWNTG